MEIGQVFKAEPHF